MGCQPADSFRSTQASTGPLRSRVYNRNPAPSHEEPARAGAACVHMLIHHALVGLQPKSDAARVKLLEDLAPGNYRGEKLWILDVGANTGAWTSALVKNLPAACLARGVQALFVEPQPLMQPLLEATIAKLRHRNVNATHLKAAAWTRADALRLDVPGQNVTKGDYLYDSVGASVVSSRAQRWMRHPPRSIVVPAVDLAETMRTLLEPEEIVYLRLDIEGAEVTVLPHLLMTGTLCLLVDYLHMEWHHEPQVEHLALRFALEPLLAACPGGGPRAVAHEGGKPDVPEPRNWAKLLPRSSSAAIEWLHARTR